MDPPTLAMTFGVNDSPFVGQDGGKFLTSNMLYDRLVHECDSNVCTLHPLWVVSMTPLKDINPSSAYFCFHFQLCLLLQQYYLFLTKLYMS